MTFSIENNLQLEDEEEIDMKIKYKISFAEELSKKAFNPVSENLSSLKNLFPTPKFKTFLSLESFSVLNKES